MAGKKSVVKQEYTVSKEVKKAVLEGLIKQMIDAIYTTTIQHKVLKSVGDEKGMLQTETALVTQEKMKLGYEKELMAVERE